MTLSAMRGLRGCAQPGGVCRGPAGAQEKDRIVRMLGWEGGGLWPGLARRKAWRHAGGGWVSSFQGQFSAESVRTEAGEEEKVP